MVQDDKSTTPGSGDKATRRLEVPSVEMKILGRSRFGAKVQECSSGPLKCWMSTRHPNRAVEETVGIRGREFRERSELEGQIGEFSAYTWNLNEGG